MNRVTQNLLRDYGVTIGVAVLFALLIRTYGVEAYRIPTPAMRPTLEPGDTIFVGKWPFPGRLPRLGEVVVFTAPNVAGDGNVDYIKRVVAQAGDRVEVREGRLWVNGKEAAFTPGPAPACGTEKLAGAPPHEICLIPPTLASYGPSVVPSGHVFVLGDLRSAELHETKRLKSWGMIPLSTLSGKPLVIWLSVDASGDRVRGGWFPQFRFDRMLRGIQ